MDSREIKRKYHVTRYIVIALLINIALLLFFYSSMKTARAIFVVFALIATAIALIGAGRNLGTWNRKTERPLFYDDEFPEPTELEKENYEENKKLERIHGKDAVFSCSVCGAPYTSEQSKCFECGTSLAAKKEN